jgi:nitroreductase
MQSACMHKTLLNEFNMIHELLSKRYSTRAFSDKKIEPEKIISLLDAARWSPSSGNEQPWRFIVAEKDNEETHKKIVEALNPGNKVWAQHAPLLILTIAKLISGHNNQINKHAFYDVGSAAAHLTVQATSADLFVRQMGGFNEEKARVLFSIPDNYAPVSVLAIGYKGDPENLPEEYRQKELLKRTRKEINEIAFTENFGSPFELVDNQSEVN